MTFKAASLALAAAALHAPALVRGHGFLSSPRSRNFYAHDIIGTGECQGSSECPPPEYCQHCLNANDGVCGKSPGGLNYETFTGWKDKEHNPMPWKSQANYTEGDLVEVDSYLDTHHNGHMELRACVMDDANPAKCSTPGDFEGNELVFIQDLIHPNAETVHPPMPADPNYPERGMYSGGQGGSLKTFRFQYKLPEGISGDRVLLQWRYITANSCSPPGYASYFATHTELPVSYWTPGLTNCTLPYPNDGARSTTWPEQFFNCAEVTILPSGSQPPTISSKPTASPTTAPPTVSEAPTKSPTPGGTPSCLSEWVDCTYNWHNCCSGFKCVQVDAAGYGRCLEDTCNEGPSPPSVTPPPIPSPTPPSGGTLCCGDRNAGYQTCSGSTHCNENESQCSGCYGRWAVVPIQRTGCCTWNGELDCSGVDHATAMNNAGCHFMQEDCEGDCGGIWQSLLF